MYIASPDDSQRCFQEYLEDAQTLRLQKNQLRPGEDVKIVDNRVQVSGQVAVMAINGLLTKVMFDKNPTNEFFVEESFPLEWMYPHLTPFGVIMKINRQPLPTLPEEVFAKDHEFWSQYSERLIGNWITYDTPVKQHRGVRGKGLSAPRLQRLRTATSASLPATTRARRRSPSSAVPSAASMPGASARQPAPPEYRPKTEAEIRRHLQGSRLHLPPGLRLLSRTARKPCSAISTCCIQPPPPIAPRMDDALIIAETCAETRPLQRSGGRSDQPAARLQKGCRGNGTDPQQSPAMEAEVRKNPTNFQAALNLASAYVQMQQNDRASAILDGIINNPRVEANAILAVAQAYVAMSNWPKLEAALEKLTKLMPEEPETLVRSGRVEDHAGQTGRRLPSPRHGAGFERQTAGEKSQSPRSARRSPQGPALQCHAQHAGVPEARSAVNYHRLPLRSRASWSAAVRCRLSRDGWSVHSNRNRDRCATIRRKICFQLSPFSAFLSR